MIPYASRCRKMGRLAGLLVLILCAGACAASPPPTVLPSPTLLPHTTRLMQTPGFWISRHPAPDRPFIDRDRIEELNQHICRDLKAAADLLDETTLTSGSALQLELEKELGKLARKRLFLMTGESVSAGMLSHLRQEMAMDTIPDFIPVRYGIVVRFSHQRVLPTDIFLSEDSVDIDFDELQNSALDAGTPVRLLHVTRDGNWWYAASDISGGWIHAETLAFCNREQARRYIRPERMAVSIRAKSDLFLDPEMTRHHEIIRMGVVLPLIHRNSNTTELRLPFRGADGALEEKTGYTRTSDLHEGFLDPTPRTIIQQAFELLHAPYGWGGMYGEQDCSRFIQEVFATTGIRMPRNSVDQAKVGRLPILLPGPSDIPGRMESLADHAIGGSTLLYLKGHIMLYLGQDAGRHYVIHSTYSYRMPAGETDTVVRVNRVAVSDLFLGQGSRRGSLADRLVSFRNIGF